MLRSNHRSVLILVGLLITAAWSVAYNAAVAANPVDALPDANEHGVSELKIKPEHHDFGAVELTHQSLPQTITATNKSRSTSVVFSSVVTSAPFLIQRNGCTGALSAGHSCEVEVLFDPNSLGQVKDNAGLTFTDSASNSPQDVALNGSGKPHHKRHSPTPTATASPTTTPSPSPSVSSTPTFTPSPRATQTATATCTTQATPSVAGLALIAGGQGSDGTPLNTAEVFNPVTNTFTLTTALSGSNMTDARYSHAAAATSTTTAFASVTVTGGIDATGATNTTEFFSSSTNKFTAGGNMVDSRQGHTATFLVTPAGELLVTGGRDATGTVLKSADLIVLVPSEAPPPSTMNTPRVNAAASDEQFFVHNACIPPKTALITGGSDGVNTLQTAEVFDSSTSTFTLTDQLAGGSQMNAPRVFHTATLYSDILIAGGLGAAGVAQASAEVFNPLTNTFTLTTDLGGTNMTVARAMHTATGIGGPYVQCCPNQVLITGGIDSSGHALASAEVFDAATNSFTAVGSMHSARFDHAAAFLSNGKVLITGGEDGSGTTLNTAEIYDPVTKTFTLTTDPSLGGNNMNVARKLHTATAY